MKIDLTPSDKSWKTSQLIQSSVIFFGAYLNQDYELSGDTIAEVVECYKQGTPVDAHERMLSEMGRFKREHPDPDRAFEETYGQDFSPDLWGRTAASFFEELTRLLSE
ncbi:contact-dependent growth inhibition system immunity protein [Paraburkholderia youngii]|uniref:contact-dependent growth inhibition system immunity protein n=1 Tax=Paraburkholderia youngii TaxID=2782701 RepID=UPI001592EF5D|nr:contact-dependent growth inhibition system immunity protein [Paraburkholderia youngii]